MKMKWTPPATLALALGAAVLASVPALAATVTVQSLRATDGPPVAEARVTIFTPDLLFFREARTDASGTCAFTLVGDGDYRLGVAALNFDYQEVALTVNGAAVSQSFTLAPESQPGRWSVIGNTSPELIDGTGSGTLLPTGEFFMWSPGIPVPAGAETRGLYADAVYF